MSRREEKINAIQNVGAVLFIIGILGGSMAKNEIALIVFFTIACVGISLIYAAEYIVDKLKNRKEQKNKGSVTDQSTEPLS